MDVMHRQTPSLLSYSSSSASSTLNPKAPIYIPMASYQTVEDFSDEWWDLVHSSPCFRDYWLHDCFEDPESDYFFADDYDLVLPDFDAFFDSFLCKQEKEEEERRKEKELITVAALKWSKSCGRVEAPIYFEKTPKIVKSVRVNPRTINQPR